MLFSSVYCFHFTSNVLYIFVTGYDSTIDLALDKSIDIDVNGIMRDTNIGSSSDPIKMIEKTLKKLMRISFICYSLNRAHKRD